MSSYPLSLTYRCSAVPGCSQKACYYKYSQDKYVLFCKFHKLTEFKLDPNGGDFKRMFTSIKNVTAQEMKTLSDFSYFLQSRYILEILESDRLDLESLRSLLLFMNFVSKEIRLYDFYKKLAHFQVPKLHELNLYSNSLYTRTDALKKAIVIKETFTNIYINLPKNDKLKKLLFESLKLLRKEKPKGNREEIEYISLVRMFKPLLLYSVTPKDLEFISFFYVYTIDLFFEIINNSSVLNFIEKSRRKPCQLTLKRIEQRTGIKLREYQTERDFRYFMNAGISLHRIGELEKALSCFYDANDVYYGTPAQKRVEEEWIELRYHRGLVYYDLTLFKKALIDLERYLEAHHKFDEFKIIVCKKYIALCYAQLSEIKNSLTVYQEYKDRFSMKDKLEIKAVICFKSGNYLKSVLNFKKIKKEKKSIMDSFFTSRQNQRIVQFKHSILESIAYAQLGDPSYSLENIDYWHRYIVKCVHENHPIFAEYWKGIAYIHEMLGNYQTALECLKRAKINEKVNYKEEVLFLIQIHIQLASVYSKINDKNNYSKNLDEIDLIQQKLFINLEEVHFLEGRFHLQQNSFDLARKCFLKGIKIQIEENGPDSFHVVFFYQQIAETYVNDTQSIQKYLKRAQKILARLCDKDSPEIFLNYYKYIECLISSGANRKARKAAKYCQKEIRTIIQNSSDITRNHFYFMIESKLEELLNQSLTDHNN